MRKLRIGDKVKIYQSGYPEAGGEITNISSWNGAPVYHVSNHGRWHENFLQLVDENGNPYQPCFCDENKEFLPSCFNCIEQFYP